MLLRVYAQNPVISGWWLPSKATALLLGITSALTLQSAVAKVGIPLSTMLNQQREQAVLLARKGQLTLAIQRLQRLLQQDPQNKKIQADLIVLLRQAGMNQQIAQLDIDQQVTQLPAYAVMPWLGALRDVKAYSRAKAAVEVLKPYYVTHVEQDVTPVDLEIFNVLISAESRDIARAKAGLAKLNLLANLNKDQQSKINYAKQLVADLTDPRALAVQKAKDGNVPAAIIGLKRLHQQDPDNKKILADLIVLLRDEGQDQQIISLMDKQSPTILPDYALMPWLLALRDSQYTDQAINLLKYMQQRFQTLPKQNDLSVTSLNIMLAMIQAEVGQAEQAKTTLQEVDDQQLSSNQYARLAYAWRLVGDYPQVLKYADSALASDSKNKLAIQQKVSALNSMGSVYAAGQLALSNKTYFKDAELQQYTADQQVTKLNEAISQKYYLDGQGKFYQENVALDQALTDMQALIETVGANSPSYARLNYDYIYGLRTRERWQDAINTFNKLDTVNLAKAPPYTRRAVADAYLALKEPEKSLHLYQQLLWESPQIDVSLYLSLYDNYLALEDYESAGYALEQLDQVIPALTWSPQQTDTPIAKWRRLDVDRSKAMFEAYRNHNDKAANQLADLYAKAPLNTGLMDSYATVLRWQGLPQQADRLLNIARQYKPEDRWLKLSSAEVASDLGEYPRWEGIITELYESQPTNTAIKSNYARWQDRSRPSISAETTMGRSQADNSTVSQVNGNRDRESYVRINSPWIDYNWRPYVEYRDQTQEDGNNSTLDNQRVGVGLEWDKERKNAWIALSQQVDGENQGVSLGWSQYLNDHWRYSLSYDSAAYDTPIKALQHGYSATSWNAAINWKQDETRSASLSYRGMDIDDGNLRQSIYFGGNQRIFANEHHITNLGAGVYFEQNSQPGGTYFNPSSNQSYGLNLTHDWVTWRHYERAFTQHFEVATGFGQQSGFGAEPYLDLQYQHRWKLSRTWQLHYGLGWGSHVYDGNREHRIYGLLGLDGLL